MRMMSEMFFLVSKIISVSVLFFLIFCKKIFKLCLIINCLCHLQPDESS